MVSFFKRKLTYLKLNNEVVALNGEQRSVWAVRRVGCNFLSGTLSVI